MMGFGRLTRRGGGRAGPETAVRPGMGLVRGAATCLFCLGLSACSAFTSEEPPVADSTLVQVLIELHLASARAELQHDLPPGLRDSIFAHYHIDEAQFNAAVQYYAERPRAYANLYDAVQDRLNPESELLAE